MANPKHRELYNCDRCGFQSKKKKLKKQKGLWVCHSCYDDKDKENKPVNMKLGSPRANATTLTAVDSPTIFIITAAGGITPSHSVDSETTTSVSLGITTTPTKTFGNSFYMKVVGTGAIDITVDPQIVAGSQGDILTLEGTDDTNTVQLDDLTGVELVSTPFILRNGSIITLVYDTTKSKWVEVSRN